MARINIYLQSVHKGLSAKHRLHELISYGRCGLRLVFWKIYIIQKRESRHQSEFDLSDFLIIVIFYFLIELGLYIFYLRI